MNLNVINITLMTFDDLANSHLMELNIANFIKLIFIILINLEKLNSRNFNLNDLSFIFFMNLNVTFLNLTNFDLMDLNFMCLKLMTFNLANLIVDLNFINLNFMTVKLNELELEELYEFYGLELNKVELVNFINLMSLLNKKIRTLDIRTKIKLGKIKFSQT